MVKKKPVPKSKNIVKQDLSAIENKLLEYARKSKPVFLYGKDSADSEGAVNGISESLFMKCKPINGRHMNGEDVYNKLTNQYNGILLKHKGSLFVKKLHCDREDNEARKYYRKLARVVKERRIKRHENPSCYPDKRIMSPFIDVATKWLVVHASSRKGFPLYFKSQFKMISLDGEVLRKKKRSQRIPDNKFKQLCIEVEKECPRRLTDERIFFKELSKMSKNIKYDESRRGYTPKTAKKRYYEVAPSKKANQ